MKPYIFRQAVFVITALLIFAACENPSQERESTPAPEDKIPITTAADLAKIGIDTAYPLNGNYTLDAEVTLNNWMPIGNSDTPFSGTFDGKGHTINLQGFAADAITNRGSLGIFSSVKGVSETAKVSIKNLKISSSVNQTSAAADGQVLGLLAGFAENTEIDTITLSGSFAYQSARTLYLGGVAGVLNEGTVVKNCITAMTLDIKPGSGKHPDIPPSGNPYSYIGGFVGMFRNGAGIEKCHNTAAVSATSTVSNSQIFVGGVAGGGWLTYSAATNYQGYIIDSSSTGNITGKAKGFWTFVGGIAACIMGDSGDMTDNRNTTRIVRCYATGTVSAADTDSGWSYVGGIVGYNYTGSLVSQCYFNGAVIANKGSDYTGGIAGYNSQTKNHNSRIKDCWSAGTVNGRVNGGGIVGQQQVNSLLSNCYSRSAITVIAPPGQAGSSSAQGAGGIAGYTAGVSGDNAAADLRGCVALNPSISGTGGFERLGRVIGDDGGATLANNYGWTGMSLTVSGAAPETPYTKSVKGEECGEKPDQAFYTGLGWDFAQVWKIGTDGYPHLQWEQ